MAVSTFPPRDEGSLVFEGVDVSDGLGTYALADEANGNDTLDGGDGDDQLQGQGGNDVLYRGADDVICGDDNADLVNGAAAGNGVFATKSVACYECITSAAGQFDTNKQATKNINWRIAA